MAQMVEAAAGKSIENARLFLQCLQEDQGLRDLLKGLNSAVSLQECITNSGFCFTTYELVQAFIEHFDVFPDSCEGGDSSLYEKGLLELL